MPTFESPSVYQRYYGVFMEAHGPDGLAEPSEVVPTSPPPEAASKTSADKATNVFQSIVSQSVVTPMIPHTFTAKTSQSSHHCDPSNITGEHPCVPLQKLSKIAGMTLLDKTKNSSTFREAEDLMKTEIDSTVKSLLRDKAVQEFKMKSGEGDTLSPEDNVKIKQDVNTQCSKMTQEEKCTLIDNAETVFSYQLSKDKTRMSYQLIGEDGKVLDEHKSSGSSEVHESGENVRGESYEKILGSFFDNHTALVRASALIQQASSTQECMDMAQSGINLNATENSYTVQKNGRFVILDKTTKYVASSFDNPAQPVLDRTTTNFIVLDAHTGKIQQMWKSSNDKSKAFGLALYYETQKPALLPRSAEDQKMLKEVSTQAKFLATTVKDVADYVNALENAPTNISVAADIVKFYAFNSFAVNQLELKGNKQMTFVVPDADLHSLKQLAQCKQSKAKIPFLGGLRVESLEKTPAGVKVVARKMGFITRVFATGFLRRSGRASSKVQPIENDMSLDWSQLGPKRSQAPKTLWQRLFSWRRNPSGKVASTGNSPQTPIIEVARRAGSAGDR